MLKKLRFWYGRASLKRNDKDDENNNNNNKKSIEQGMPEKKSQHCLKIKHEFLSSKCTFMMILHLNNDNSNSCFSVERSAYSLLFGGDEILLRQ